jgi:hypothetical protein
LGAAAATAFAASAANQQQNFQRSSARPVSPVFLQEIYSERRNSIGEHIMNL